MGSARKAQKSTAVLRTAVPFRYQFLYVLVALRHLVLAVAVHKGAQRVAGAHALLDDGVHRLHNGHFHIVLCCQLHSGRQCIDALHIAEVIVCDELFFNVLKSNNCGISAQLFEQAYFVIIILLNSSRANQKQTENWIPGYS